MLKGIIMRGPGGRAGALVPPCRSHGKSENEYLPHMALRESASTGSLARHFPAFWGKSWSLCLLAPVGGGQRQPVREDIITCMKGSKKPIRIGWAFCQYLTSPGGGFRPRFPAARIYYCRLSFAHVNYQSCSERN